VRFLPAFNLFATFNPSASTTARLGELTLGHHVPHLKEYVRAAEDGFPMAAEGESGLPSDQWRFPPPHSDNEKLPLVRLAELVT
jgi:hypothetical protein